MTHRNFRKYHKPRSQPLWVHRHRVVSGHGLREVDGATKCGAAGQGSSAGTQPDGLAQRLRVGSGAVACAAQGPPVRDRVASRICHCDDRRWSPPSGSTLAASTFPYTGDPNGSDCNTTLRAVTHVLRCGRARSRRERCLPTADCRTGWCRWIRARRFGRSARSRKPTRFGASKPSRMAWVAGLSCVVALRGSDPLELGQALEVH